MLNQEFQDQINGRIEEVLRNTIIKIVDEEIQKFLENDENIERIYLHSEMRGEITRHIHTTVPCEIGNRLRCGIYDNNLVKKAFDEFFEYTLKEQFKAELRRIAVPEIKLIIKELLLKNLE